MPLWIITFFLGIFALTFCPKLPSLYWLLLLMPVIFIWYLARTFGSLKTDSVRNLKVSEIGLEQHHKENKKYYLKNISFQTLIFALGFCWALIYTHMITFWSLPEELEGKRVLITGYVVALPSKKPRGITFALQTDTIAAEKKNAKIKLSWYGNYFPLKVGDKVQLLVRLKRPHGVLNPGGFDMEKHLLVHHIRATGYVVNSEVNKILASHPYYYPLATLRQFLINKMEQALISEELMPIIIAFVTGAEDKITQAQWQIMRDTGTSYLVAIAGLHIGLVASVAFVFTQYLWRLSGILPLIMPAKEVGIIVGLLMGFIYGAVSGFSIPTQRSLVMLVMFSLAVLLRRHTKSWNAWLWSLFLVLIINPLAILTIGFWLSFSSVAAIIYAVSGRIKQSTSHIKKLWRMQLAVTLALLPFTLLFFQQFSLITLLANLIAMPVVCLVVVPMSLLGALCLLVSSDFGGWILWCSAKILHLIWWWLTFLAHSFSCSWYHPIYNWWILIAAIIGILILLAPRGLPTRIVGLLWLTPLFFYIPPAPNADGKVWFTLLDVGQGLAAVVRTKNHILLYDTGPKFFENDAGTSVIIPYLRQVGIKHIDTMMVSHGDSDHSGGVASIMKSLPVDDILTSVPEKFSPYFARRCLAGQHWQWDGVDFLVLSPPKNTFLDGNNASCVLKITTGTKSLLLTGDIEREAEDLLVASYGSDLKSTFLVAPHHGSATSSTEELIKSISPQYVLFPVGYKNRFHFPNKKVVARYIENDATLLNVSHTGAITFKFENKSDILRFDLYREKIKRFWHTPCNIR